MKIETIIKVVEKYEFKDFSDITNITLVMFDGKKDYVWNTASIKAQSIEEGKKYLLKGTKGEETGIRDIRYPSYKITNCTLKEIE